MENTYLTFKCLNEDCGVSVNEDEIIDAQDLWEEHNMEELTEEEQANVVRHNAMCPECEGTLQEQKD